MNLAWPVEQEPSWSHKEYKKNWIRHCTIIAYCEKCSVHIGNGRQIGQRLHYKPVYRLYNLQDIFLYKSFSCYIRVDSNCACFSRCSSKLWVFCYFHESFDEVVLFQYLSHCRTSFSLVLHCLAGWLSFCTTHSCHGAIWDFGCDISVYGIRQGFCNTSTCTC